MNVPEQWQADIDNGMPEQTVVDYARKHLAALRDLARTPEIEAAIEATVRFIEGKTCGDHSEDA